MTNPAPIPPVDLKYQHAEVAEEVAAGWAAVLERTAFVGGPAVGEFERAYAEYSGVAHCVGVANGTDALELALRAVGVGPGDECVVPANSFIATAEAVARAGATPVFVDCDPDTYLIDTKAALAAFTERTKAVLPVHLYGQMAPVEELKAACDEQGVFLVEDAAQSQGARRNGAVSGSLGHLAGTSFYPGKNLGAYGDAGGVTTNDAELAERVRLLGAHGSQRKYVHDSLGFNSRLDTIQAVVLSAKLRRLDAWNELRRAAADHYGELLAGVDGVVAPKTLAGNEHVWHLYVVRVAERDRVLKHLQDNGVGGAIHYPTPIHLTRPFASDAHGEGSFPNAELVAGEILSLPMYPGITREQRERVVEVLAEAVR
ncbi:DegT/DnrJ/EryC1/StrS family aminotransferase [Saccharothrix longispora]|uniref:DegT/DnrJ/EryC1/StrS family aminotransferase n=1 Tax=Saccharothrix longispora TaxID=33920 RepID=UPI0028FD2AED|nr:DegT/DnrJ/EryC1/StrS family aminotransferase [Saccharothrix longispora]MBY8849404.1 DegT/DnrJ/EryC1/StrS family aminotransferase [Saccharothrix sp. MB29]MDU0292018.1 DegT/DnrJ/EryC1/StrS family aminotransferase [Saccharothrix longispora]